MDLVVGEPYAFTAVPKEGSEPLLGNKALSVRFAKYRGKDADGDLSFGLGLFVEPTGVDFVPMKGVPMNNNRNNGNNGNNNSTIAGSVVGIRNNNRRRKTRKNRNGRKNRQSRRRRN